MVSGKEKAVALGRAVAESELELMKEPSMRSSSFAYPNTLFDVVGCQARVQAIGHKMGRYKKVVEEAAAARLTELLAPEKAYREGWKDCLAAVKLHLINSGSRTMIDSVNPYDLMSPAENESYAAGEHLISEAEDLDLEPGNSPWIPFPTKEKRHGG